MPIYNEELELYIRKTFTAEDQILSHIRDATPTRGLPAISVRPEEGRLLQFLAATCNAQIALEIGTLGGYSGVWIARGLAPHGRLITVEKSPQHADVARDHFRLAGVSDQVDIRIGDAHNLLPTLSDEGPFDMIFVDAEKEGYPDYLEWSLANLRAGGVLAAGIVGFDSLSDRVVAAPAIPPHRHHRGRGVQVSSLGVAASGTCASRPGSRLTSASQE